MAKKKEDKRLTKDQAEKKYYLWKKIYLISDLKKLIIRLIIQHSMDKLKKV